MLKKLRGKLSKTRENLTDKISRALKAHKTLDEGLLEELEEILIAADVGVDTTSKILEAVKERARKEKKESSSDIQEFLKEAMLNALTETNRSGVIDLDSPLPSEPYVILMVGVNGTGKTTTIAKLARMFDRRGQKVLIAACDTFRAAATEQLQVWAKRVDADIVKNVPQADPAAVAYDAISAAKARGHQVVIADTAGRLHTKTNLMEELKKIKRVMGKALPGAPHLTLLVMDATTGQNGLRQVKLFDEAIKLDGIVLAKLDGTAKGGIVLAIADEYKMPVYYVGLGEKPEDLEKFEPKEFVEAIFD
ncbi:MAG: signal recognition particle-docking protein FtsY [Candidatus Zixiibacteriota bacterium]|nr:MAG: signal recognition particle-docking protein FtsY [candidate division Zixibacteria bacterium]